MNIERVYNEHCEYCYKLVDENMTVWCSEEFMIQLINHPEIKRLAEERRNNEVTI